MAYWDQEMGWDGGGLMLLINSKYVAMLKFDSVIALMCY